MASNGEPQAIEVTDLLMTYGVQDARPAVNKVSLTFPAGQCTVLLGPSGCGKTTILRSIAGLLTPDAGRITIGDATVYDQATGINVNPELRRLGMVFQSYALWPHLSVRDNVSYPLLARKVPKKEAHRETDERLGWVGLDDKGDRFIHELSGGQQQRVALARAIVGHPNAVLFDEPLSNLDARLREHMRLELLELRQATPYTAVYVTHDQLEAMTLGDRVVIVRDGEIEQAGTPREVYQRPRTRFVADFMGIPNLIRGTVREVAVDRVMVETPIGTLPSVPSRPDWRSGEEATVAVRPTAVDLEPVGHDARDGSGPTGTVIRSVFQGATIVTLVQVGDVTFTAESLTDLNLSNGDTVTISPRTHTAFALLDD